MHNNASTVSCTCQLQECVFLQCKPVQPCSHITITVASRRSKTAQDQSDTKHTILFNLAARFNLAIISASRVILFQYQAPNLETFNV